MTEVVEAPDTEAAESETKSERRGRPRSQETIDRDNQVLEVIKGAADAPTREQLAEATGLEPNKVYLSLYRLQRDGAIVRGREGGKHVWRVASDEDEASVEG